MKTYKFFTYSFIEAEETAEKLIRDRLYSALETFDNLDFKFSKEEDKISAAIEVCKLVAKEHALIKDNPNYK